MAETAADRLLSPLQPVLRPLRRGLDGLYTGCGYLAALFLILLIGIIVVQMSARWFGFVFPGSTDYAGYCMAAASFFAMAYTLNHGAHIRVTLVLSRLGRWRRLAELWCFGIGALLACYFAWFAVKGVRISHMINDISQGQDAWPLWIPQTSMAIGTIVLAICLVDHWLRLLVGGPLAIGDGSVEDHHTE